MTSLDTVRPDKGTDSTGISGSSKRRLWTLVVACSGVALVVVPLAPLAFHWLPGDLSVRPPLPAGASQFAGEIAANTQPADLTTWFVSLLPTNPIAAAANGAMLQLILFSLLLWLASISVWGAAQASSALLVFGCAMAVFVVFTHRSNIERMWQGNENRARRLWLLRPR